MVIVALGLGLVAAAVLSAARWWQHLSPWSLVLAASIASTVAFGILEGSVGSLEGSSAVVFVAAVCLGVALPLPAQSPPSLRHGPRRSSSGLRWVSGRSCCS